MRSIVRLRMATAAVAVSLGSAPTLSAQANVEVTFGATGDATRVLTEEPSVRERLTGLLIGGEAGAALGRFSVSGRYAEGTIDASGGDIGQDLVEGEVLLGVTAFPWLAFRIGPHVRSFTFSDGTRRRWVLWEGRVRAQARLLDQMLLSYVEIWRVLGADVSGSEEFDAAQGAQGGIEFRFESVPVFTRIGYRIDRSRLVGITQPQTVEQITVAVGFRRR